MEGKDNNQIPLVESDRTRVLAGFTENRAVVVALFFFLALLVRVYFAFTHPDFDNIFAVRGEPYSDGLTWTSAGVRLAQGFGLGSVYRPGFSVLLALFYVWFGYSAAVITLCEIIIGALTAALIYLVGERALNRWIAGAATLFFIFDPSQLSQTPQATTEPLGLLFFVASIYALLLKGKKRRLSLVLLSGVLLALSNLTRPLTLFCVPFYVLQLAFDHWRQTRKVLLALLPALAFCGAIFITMSPWLIRQKATHGVWAVSTNLGEALYGATSPKYGTWTSLVRGDADRAGIPPTIAARYHFFVSASLANIRQYPGFYAKEVADSYWEFLNSFHYKIRSQSRTFSFPQWTGLREGQALFILLLAAFLLGPVVWWWVHCEPGRSVIFLAAGACSMILWWVFPYVGFLILLGGMAAAFWRFRWENISLLAVSVAGAGIGDALFNNAILYRAVLMTDWIYTFFYFLAFHVLAERATQLVASAPPRLLRKEEMPMETAWAQSSFPELERRLKRAGQGVLLVCGVFILAGTVKLSWLNFGPTNPAPLPRLTVADKKQILEHLRRMSPVMRASFPDPAKQPVHFVQARPGRIADALKRKASADHAKPTPMPIPFAQRSEVVVSAEQLLPIVYYFPRLTDFGVRDKIFKERPFQASIMRTAHSMTIFPGKVPPFVVGRPGILVGWIEGPHPGGSWIGEVMQCVAIVPLTKKGKPDYRHALVATPQGSGIL